MTSIAPSSGKNIPRFVKVSALLKCSAGRGFLRRSLYDIFHDQSYPMFGKPDKGAEQTGSASRRTRESVPSIVVVKLVSLCIYRLVLYRLSYRCTIVLWYYNYRCCISMRMFAFCTHSSSLHFVICVGPSSQSSPCLLEKSTVSSVVSI